MIASFDDIAHSLNRARTVIVASHLRPDADALGSTIAMALWLKSCGKNVLAWNQDGAIGKFSYLPEYALVAKPPATPMACEVFLALDTSVKNRLGTVVDAVAPGAIWINLDHHVSNENFGDLNYVDPTTPATGQILVEFLRHVGASITPAIATNLYAAMSTDTGSFQYEGTDARTFDAAAYLVHAGVQVGPLSRAMYDNQPRRRFDLLRHALNHAEFSDEGRIASFVLTLEDARRLEVLPEDNEGIIDQLRSVEGVLAAVFFEELPEGQVRVSARSKSLAVDVCKICSVFQGGGHPMAAGARISGEVGMVKTQFLKVVSDEILKRN